METAIGAGKGTPGPATELIPEKKDLTTSVPALLTLTRPEAREQVGCCLVLALSLRGSSPYFTHCSTFCTESVPQPRQDSEMPEEGEEAEPMDATNEDDDAMMAMMGLAGFGSTKVSSRRVNSKSCPVA